METQKFRGRTSKLKNLIRENVVNYLFSLNQVGTELINVLKHEHHKCRLISQ